MDVRPLAPDDVGLIARIDRSEHIDVEYTVAGGRIVEQPVSMAEVPPWDPVGTGFFSVASEIAFVEPILARGGTMLGAFDGDELFGVAVVEGAFEPPLAWLAFLHVSRPHRRRGVATALWDAAVAVAVTAGAEAMYVSAVPTGSAVGFYLSRGCELAEPVHPRLYALEPDDVHLVYRLGVRS